MPNFHTGPIAHAMRRDGAPIPRKMEAEQAHVLFKLLGFYVQHGSGWRTAAADWIGEMEDRRKAQQEPA